MMHRLKVSTITRKPVVVHTIFEIVEKVLRKYPHLTQNVTENPQGNPLKPLDK